MDQFNCEYTILASPQKVHVSRKESLVFPALMMRMTTYLVRLVYQLADDHVVEVVYVLPLDALPLVLLLLLLQHQLDEDLLQLLVAVVDAELLETVLAEDLETVYVKDANHGRVRNIGLEYDGAGEDDYNDDQDTGYYDDDNDVDDDDDEEDHHDHHDNHDHPDHHDHHDDDNDVLPYLSGGGIYGSIDLADYPGEESVVEGLVGEISPLVTCNYIIVHKG